MNKHEQKCGRALWQAELLAADPAEQAAQLAAAGASGGGASGGGVGSAVCGRGSRHHLAAAQRVERPSTLLGPGGVAICNQSSCCSSCCVLPITVIVVACQVIGVLASGGEHHSPRCKCGRSFRRMAPITPWFG